MAAAGLGSVAVAALWLLVRPGEPAAVRATGGRVADAGPAPCRHMVESDPPGARIYHGDRLLGMTPVDLDRPCEEAWALRLTLKGYLLTEMALDENAQRKEKALLIRLEPDTAKRVAAPPDAAVNDPVSAPEPSRAQRPASPKVRGAPAEPRSRPRAGKRLARPPSKEKKPARRHLYFK